MRDNGGIDLWKLECDFATNPTSLTFVRLAEIYLDMGRLVEALVVAKKGIKNHPELATGRMLLTRIYISQAKYGKAIDELKELIKLQPDHKEAHRRLSEIHLKLGHQEEGIRHLKKARDIDPYDQAARRNPLQARVEIPPFRRAPRKRLIETLQPTYDEPVKPTGRKRFRSTLTLAAVLVVLLSGYLAYTYLEGIEQERINDHILRARVLFARDSHPGYAGALEHYQEILKLDESHVESLSRAAYSCAVLVGEHGADRKLIDQGRNFLARVRAGAGKPTIAGAAEGMLQLYGGGGPSAAIETLEQEIKKHPRSSSVRTALGFAYLEKGDLRRAAEHLQRSATNQDQRAIHALGRCYFRLSLYRKVSQAFARAVRDQSGI